MDDLPTIKLSRLRDIGWSLWDPIELWDIRDGGPHTKSCRDEYDSYLLQAVSKLRAGSPESEVVDYFVAIETERMGIEKNETTRSRAKNTVAAIKEYLATLPVGPFRVG